jgi:hypothetical protein
MKILLNLLEFMAPVATLLSAAMVLRKAYSSGSVLNDCLRGIISAISPYIIALIGLLPVFFILKHSVKQVPPEWLTPGLGLGCFFSGFLSIGLTVVFAIESARSKNRVSRSLGIFLLVAILLLVIAGMVVMIVGVVSR